MAKKYSASEYHQGDLRRALAAVPGLEHLQVDRYGASLTLRSALKDDVHAHARLTRISADYWVIEFPKGERWERAPERDSFLEIVSLLLAKYPWHLAPV